MPRSFKRSFILFSSLIAIALIIFLYISYLQLWQYSFFKKKSIINCTRYQSVEGLRGIITDCQGRVIAMTQPVFQFFWKKHPKKCSLEDLELIRFLEELRNKPLYIEELYKKNQDSEFLLLNNLSFQELSLFVEKFPHQQRIKIHQILERYYPQKNLFAHLIGYLSQDQQEGIFGLEKIYNEKLIGKKGLSENTVNAKGTVLQKEILVSPESGKKIETTLNLDIQKMLFDIFPKEESGCGIIIDAEDGALKALCSFPTFDPHIFLHQLSKEEWNKVTVNNALLNRAFQAQYPPGSLYKLIIALLLLEEKIITSHTKWFCNGHIRFKERDYHCNKKYGHGIVAIEESLAESCNIPFYTAAIEGLSIDLIHKHASGFFGLGKKTGLFFSESKGTIPSKQWKKKKYGLPWFQGETLSACIGQGATTTTPIQLAQIIMGIMKGYIIPPYILKEEKKEKIILPYKKENLLIIQNSMRLGALKGSSKVLRKLKNWTIHAKTGTAQVIALKNGKQEETKKKKQHHGLFACLAQYKNQKPFILVLVIEHNSSSRFTVQTALKFFQELEKWYNLNSFF